VETHLADFIRDSPQGREAEAILRSCVHCGFCTATCPTYQLLGDELDGPRGRIYLIKQMLEGCDVSQSTQLHLDRCLTCRSCETTCPSGVRYGRLVDIGRHVAEQRVPRSRRERAHRWLLRKALASRPLFATALATGRFLQPLLPTALARRVPRSRPAGVWPPARHPRRMLALMGCVQPALAPSIDAAMARVLDRVGISLVGTTGSGCCGALSHHLGAPDDALRLIRRNIDAWWHELDRGAEAIVVTASGCGVMVKDYGELLRDDPAYAERARRVASLARDPVEVIAAEWKRLAPYVAMDRGSQRVAFHTPCSLQHGQRLGGRVDEILEAIGLELTPVADAHLCCGSAGTYSILQPRLAAELRDNKLRALEAGRPSVIATANIGCMMHLASGTRRGVRHWIELLDARLRRAG
jgi:glycolate oxidase iron-sulfur subunit